MENIRERDERHALMMSHVGAHDGHPAIFGNSRSRKIERFVKTITSARAGVAQSREVLGCRLRIDHCRQRRRVRGDDHVFTQAPFEAQTRDAEIGVLISKIQVARVVGRF